MDHVPRLSFCAGWRVQAGAAEITAVCCSLALLPLALQPPGPARGHGVGVRVAARAAELSQLCFSCSLSSARVNKYLEFELHYLARTISFFHVLCSLEFTSSSSDIGELFRDKKKFKSVWICLLKIHFDNSHLV